MLFKRLSSALVLGATLSLAVASTALAAQPVWKHGTGSINQTFHADLDTGTFNNDVPLGTGDLFFAAVSSTKRYLQAESGAHILRMSSKPGYAKCASKSLVGGAYNVKDNIGFWFCYMTDEGRLGRFKVVSAPLHQPLTITYTTWCKPADAC